MTGEIAKLIAEAEAIAGNAGRTFGKLDAEELNWKPDAKSWSVGQCFEHLVVTNDLYFPNIRKVLDGRHRNNFFSRIPFAVDLIAALMKNSLKPEQPRKMKTFKIFEPAASGVPESIVEDFAENQLKMIELMKGAEAFDIYRIKIAEPLSRALNLRLRDAFEILILHEKRHFRQAERVLQTEGFPKKR